MIAAELVRQAQLGDQRALGDLLAALRPQVVRFCARRIDRNDAEDVAQEALMRFTNALKAYRPVKPVEAYAIGIASNCVASAHHRRYRAAMVQPVADVPDAGSVPPADEAALRAETSRDLARALLTLTAKQREIVLMRLAGFSVDEVSQHVCASPGSVRVSHHRALRSLRKTCNDRAIKELA